MMGIVTGVIIAVIGFSTGLLAYRFGGRRTASRFSQLIWGGGGAAIAGSAFFVARLIVPAVDDPEFAGARFMGIGASDKDIGVGINFPSRMALQQDGVVSLHIANQQLGHPVPRGNYSGTFIASPKVVDIVTDQFCASRTMGASGVPGCEKRTEEQTREVEITWRLTPLATGTYTMTIVGDELPLPRSGEKATAVMSDVNALTVYGMQYEDGIYRYADVSIDVVHKRFEFPITFVTSLGVTQRTYDVLAMLGVVVSFLFGSGVLLKDWKRPDHPDPGPD